MNINAAYKKYKAHLQKVADISYTISVLSWDQEVNMPINGGAERSRQIATLSGVAHEMSTSDKLGDLLYNLQASKNALNETQKRNVAESLKAYKKKKKLPTEFVQRLSKTTSTTYQAWHKAKNANDYLLFEPHLKEMVLLKQEEASLKGYKEHPYDALLNDFEPGETTEKLNKLFGDVRAQLVDFVQNISACTPPADSWMFKHYDKDKQWQFGIDMLKQMGYNFKSGRQDVSAHPFTTSFGTQDIRVTTRINEKDFHEMLWSCIHEGGHALYEQGFKTDNYGLPAASAVSLGIHESQSRLWENNIGRCIPYWKANYGKLQQLFPENLGGLSLLDFYKSMNVVKPSLVRTNADELTYHFHILVRFEIEKALIEGSIDTKNLDDYWNIKYKEYLGIDVPNAAQGVLQDIHWSHGAFGYFPTYSLGSFYAAQFYTQACMDIPNLEDSIAQGNLKPLLQWLRTNIHQHGKLYSAEELCIRITGEPLNFTYFMQYAKKKYNFIYGL